MTAKPQKPQADQVIELDWDYEFWGQSLTPEDSNIMLYHQKLNGIASHLSDSEIMSNLTKLGNLPPAVKSTLLELADLS